MWLNKTKFPIRGIDLSHWNHPIHYEKISEIIDFVFLKITEGTKFRDHLFDLHYTNFRLKEVAIGVYHFFNFGIDGKEQANHFLNTLNQREIDLPLVVDVEQAGNPIHPDKFVIQELKAFVNIIQEQTGQYPMIYTNGDGYNRFIKNNFETLPIWLAGNNLERVESIKPLFWQFNQHGIIEGASGEIDLNVFRGNLDDWRDFRNSVNQSFQ